MFLSDIRVVAPMVAMKCLQVTSGSWFLTTGYMGVSNTS